MSDYTQKELEQEYKRRCKQNREVYLKKVTLYMLPDGKITDDYNEAYPPNKASKVICFLLKYFVIIVMIVYSLWVTNELWGILR